MTNSKATVHEIARRLLPEIQFQRFEAAGNLKTHVEAAKKAVSDANDLRDSLVGFKVKITPYAMGCVTGESPLLCDVESTLENILDGSDEDDIASVYIRFYDNVYQHITDHLGSLDDSTVDSPSAELEAIIKLSEKFNKWVPKHAERD